MATDYDIIIRNGVIIDGSGNPWFRGDICIKDGRIKHIGQMGGADARHELEANGLVVVPGFIDIHAHSDFTLLVDPLAESKIRQGVTTEIVGQCGESAAPITDETVEYSEEKHPSFYRDYFTITWRTMSEYCDVLSTNGLSINVVPFIGHGTVRQNVMGFENRPPTAEELEQMKTFVRDAMEQGAFGLSSGLFYMPGGFAQTDELIELCRVVREYRGIYASHIRNESDYVADAVKEAIEIGRKSGIPVQISHLKASGRMNWGKTQDMLNLIEAARNEGIEVTADVYPWTASSTGLDAGLPSWVHEGGVEKLLERLQDPETRVKIKNEIETTPGRPDWENILKSTGLENVMIVNFEPDRNLQGKRISEIAAVRGKDPLETVLYLLIEAKERGVSAVFFDMDEQDVIRVFQHPSTCISSDGCAIAAEGPFAKESCHPRYYGTYPRVLSYFIREKKILPMQAAIRKITSFPAQKLGLLDRGLLREKFVADLVLFDPVRVKNKATYQQPHQYPVGIEYVLVNGEVTIAKGEHTQKKPGQVLKHNP